MSFMSKHRLKGDIVTDLFELINTYIFLETGNYKQALKLSEFHHYLQNVIYPIQKHYYCPKCFSEVEGEGACCLSCQQDLCPEDKSSSFFLTMPIINQLETILAQPELFDSVSKAQQAPAHQDGLISDITQGELYKQFRNQVSNDDHAMHITLTINTDGVRVWRSNHYDIWPVYLCINELPQHMRFIPKHILLPALWKGSKKPVMLTFLKPLFHELKMLEKGIVLSTHEGPKVIKVFLLAGTFDLPARAMVLNMTQYNGSFSCHRCLHPGERLTTGSRGPGTNTFPYTQYTHRSDSTVKEAGKKAAETQVIQQGVKGPSVLSYLHIYSYVQGTAVDVMHGGFLGLGRQMLDLLFGEKFRTEAFSCQQNVAKFDERLRNIQPPRSVKRMPRSLHDMAHFKASEYAMIIMMYLPAFLDIIPSNFMRHLCHLSNALFLLYKSKVTEEDLVSANYSIQRYCEQFSDLYGQKFQTSNFHNLQHIVEDVRNLGPLWNTDCFPYENASGSLVKHIFGTQSADQQVIRAVSTMHKVPHISQSVTNPQAKQFISKMLDHKWASKETVVDDDLAILGKADPTVSALEAALVQEKLIGLFEVALTKCHVVNSFTRFRHGTRVYHCRKYAKVTKRNSYTIVFRDSDGSDQYAILEKGYLVDINTGEGRDRRMAFGLGRSLTIIGEGLGAAKHCTSVSPPNFEDSCDRLIPLKNITNMCVFLQFSDLPLQCFVTHIPNITHVV